MAELYNATLADHLEDYPLSAAELEQVKKDLLLIADPRLAKILAYDGQIVGYLFALPGPVRRAAEERRPVGTRGAAAPALGDAYQRRAASSTGWAFCPQYQRLGGNALLYSELTKTVGGGAFRRAELVQVSERTELMLRDIQTLGARVCKVHRMYEKEC